MGLSHYLRWRLPSGASARETPSCQDNDPSLGKIWRWSQGRNYPQSRNACLEVCLSDQGGRQREECVRGKEAGNARILGGGPELLSPPHRQLLNWNEVAAWEGLALLLLGPKVRSCLAPELSALPILSLPNNRKESTPFHHLHHQTSQVSCSQDSWR